MSGRDKATNQMKEQQRKQGVGDKIKKIKIEKLDTTKSFQRFPLSLKTKQN